MENDELAKIFQKLNPEKDSYQKKTPLPVKEKPKLNLMIYVKKIAPFAIALIFLMLAYQKNTQSAPEPNARRIQLLTLAPMVAIPIGQNIPESILRVVAVDAKSLSKAQLQGLLLEHDLKGLHDKIRTKRTLPPGRPIFWKDLELPPEKKPLTNPVIIYSKDSA